MIGETFGSWTVINKAENKGNNIAWLCKCKCGTERSVLAYNLSSGKSKSCGCGQRNAASKANRSHGGSGTRLYRIYKGMKQRCYNQKNHAYHYYGGKGVAICDDWKSDFLKFKKWALESGYNKNMTIDRLNPNGNYSPENCRWVNMQKQQNNKLNSAFVTIGDEKKTIAEWAELNKTNKQTLYSKFYRLFEQLKVEVVDVTEIHIKLNVEKNNE